MLLSKGITWQIHENIYLPSKVPSIKNIKTNSVDKTKVLFTFLDPKKLYYGHVAMKWQKIAW